MLRLIKHIEKLLLEHDCVIVPGFGGFVKQEVVATYNVDKFQFEPSRKEVVFNETLQHNDGLLIESYMQIEKVEYKVARQFMLDDVAVLKQELNKNKSYQLGNIGFVSLGDENQMIFQSGDSEWLNMSMFGLPSFVFEPLSAKLPKKIEHVDVEDELRKDVYYIPVNKRIFHIAAAVAAIIVLLLTTSTPVKDVSRDAYTASFVPSVTANRSNVNLDRTNDVNNQIEMPASAVEVKKEEANIIAAVEKEQPSEMMISSESTKEVKVEASAKKQAPKPAAVKSKKYYIVIASFPTSEQANTYLEGVDRNVCANAAITLNKNNYRVYADCFLERDEAETYMADLRKHKDYKDAWLFITR